MPGFGQSLAYVIDPSILTMSFAPNVAVASPLAKLSESAAHAVAGRMAAAKATARTHTMRSDLSGTLRLTRYRDTALPPRWLPLHRNLGGSRRRVFGRTSYFSGATIPIFLAAAAASPRDSAPSFCRIADT